MPNNIVANILRGILIGTLCVVVMWLSFGSVVSFGWHLLRGSSISYAGWRIPVPKHYFAEQHRGMPSIWILSVGAPAFHLPSGTLTFRTWQGHPHPFSKEKDYLGFEEGLAQAAAESGHQFKSRQTISVGNRSVYCWEFARETEQPLLLLRCAFENSNIYAFYEGDPRYLPDIFGIIQGMHPEKSANGDVTKGSEAAH
jgi:hypothetical protein